MKITALYMALMATIGAVCAVPVTEPTTHPSPPHSLYNYLNKRDDITTTLLNNVGGDSLNSTHNNGVVAHLGKYYNPPNQLPIKYNLSDPLPISKLPPCHQECFKRNHHNGYPKMGDVFDMTVEDFCHRKWFQVGNWLIDKIIPCTNRGCKDCPNDCIEVAQWMLDTCGFFLEV